jgi:hypothetical protein
MKVKFLAIALLIIAASCSSDDGNGETTDFSYFPLKSNNSWDYNVTTGSDTETDNLVVTQETSSGFQLTATPSTPFGLMTNVLSSGTLNEENGKLIGTGSVDLNLGTTDNIAIDIENAPLYDQNAGNDRELFSSNGTFTQELQGYDLDINYRVSTKQLEDIAEMTVNNVTYENVIHSKLIVNASITSDVTVSGFTTALTFMEAQDVIVVDNFWAKDVGLIQSDNQLEYELEDFSSFGLTLPFPQAASLLSVQTLTGFTLE